MTHNWSIICKKASIDSTTNVISLFEIIEKITIGPNMIGYVPANLPDEFVTPFDFELVSLISNIPEKNRHPFIKIELLNAQNEKMGEPENELNVPVGAKNLRSRVVFNAIKIKGDGMYSFKVNLKDEKNGTYEQVADIPLEIELSKSPS